MLLSVQQKVIVGFSLASALLVIASVAAYKSADRLQQATAIELHTKAVIVKLEEVLSQIKDAETGQRGYLLTGEEIYLTPYYKALPKVSQEIQDLEKLTSDNSYQQQEIKILKPIVDQKLAELQQTITLRKNQGFDAALQVVRTNEGKQLMDLIRKRINLMKAEEDRLLAIRSLASQKNVASTQTIIAVTLFLNFIILSFVYYLIRREMASRQAAEKEILNLNAELEQRVEERTAELKSSNQTLEKLLQDLRRTQSQLLQSEKMSSLGQLVAGVAHEINNPVNFIYGNLVHAQEYTNSLLNLIQVYQHQYPQTTPKINEAIEETELDFLTEDLPKLLTSMKVGAVRIREIVQSLRNFSRLDEAEMKEVGLHEGLESTLMILAHRLKPKLVQVADKSQQEIKIQVIKEYGNLPKIECLAGQINQVFLNILTNAIDALEEKIRKDSLEQPKIWIITKVIDEGKTVRIEVRDNGIGMTEETRLRLFDPFFTTKDVGVGTGLGMSISYQIVVEKHGGKLECISSPGQGATFLIDLPIHPQTQLNVANN